MLTTYNPADLKTESFIMLLFYPGRSYSLKNDDCVFTKIVWLTARTALLFNSKKLYNRLELDDYNKAPSEAEPIPFTSEYATPPVINICFGIITLLHEKLNFNNN